MKPQLIITLTLTALILTGCSGIELQDLKPEDCAKLPGEKTVALINDKCGLCHKGDFANKELICGRKSVIIDSVKEGRMPKFGKLSEEELQILIKWEL